MGRAVFLCIVLNIAEKTLFLRYEDDNYTWAYS